jgi:hypothetical protein
MAKQLVARQVSTEAGELQPSPHHDRTRIERGGMMAMTIYVDEKENMMTSEIELGVEELKEVIAPGKRFNHNETLVRDTEEIELDVEELEDVIALVLKKNCNETLVRDAEAIGLEVEELEEVAAPILFPLIHH